MSPTDKDGQMIHVKLSNYMYNGLEVVCAKLGMTISDVIRTGINDVIKKELSKREQDELADNESTDFLINEYRKVEAISYNDLDEKEDAIHNLLQELRSLKAENYDGMGTEKTYERSWRVRQILAREYGKVIDLDKMSGIEQHYDFYCGRYHEKEMQYLNRLAKQYEKDKNRLKDKPIKISEKEYLIFYTDDITKQQEINAIISEIHNNLDEALARFPYIKSFKEEKGEFFNFINKVKELKKKLASEYGIFYDVEKDPRTGFYNNDFSKEELEKENNELNNLIEKYKKERGENVKKKT